MLVSRSCSFQSAVKADRLHMIPSPALTHIQGEAPAAPLQINMEPNNPVPQMEIALGMVFWEVYMAVGQNQWYHFGGFGAPPSLEPILVVGLGCSLGANRFGL